MVLVYTAAGEDRGFPPLFHSFIHFLAALRPLRCASFIEVIKQRRGRATLQRVSTFFIFSASSAFQRARGNFSRSTPLRREEMYRPS